MIPFQPGHDYKVEFSVRTEGLENTDQVVATFQPRSAEKKELPANKELPSVLAKTQIVAGNCRDWKKITLNFRTPARNSAWEKVAWLLLTVGGNSQKNGIIRIDDLKVSRERPADMPAKAARKDGRTFELSFDNATSSADFAVADNRPTEDFDLTKVPGFNGKTAFRQTSKDRHLRYPAVGNANPLRGTAVIWFRAENFEPFNPKHHGWDIRPITLFGIRFGTKDNKWADLQLVLYRGADAAGFRMSYDNSGHPRNVFASHPTVMVPLTAARRGEWHQFACVWDNGDLSIYMDGKFYSRCFMTESKRAELQSVMPDASTSFITVRGGPEEQSLQRGEISDVDDFAIYDRVLSPAEIKHLHASASGVVPSEQLLSAEFRGTMLSDGSEAVEAKLDFTVIRRLLWRDEVSRDVRHEISGPDGVAKSGVLKVGKDPVVKEKLSGLAAPGKYTMKLFFQGANDSQLTTSVSFEKPDTSWAGTKHGAEDSTPEPWTQPELDAKRDQVAVWNRVYRFESGGPFPSGISSGGRDLLSAPPVLEIETEAGKIAPKGRIVGRQSGKSFVTFTGTLTAPEFDASYSTTVEFDGFVKTELLVHRASGLRAMRVAWQVAPEFSRHLLLPAPDANQGAQRDFPYFSEAAKILYLASESGGFCWMPTGGLNWVFKPGEKVWHANKSTGTCSLDVITSPVEMPKNTPYTFCFIATPTRPPMSDFRSWRFIGGSNDAKGDAGLATTGFTRNGNLRVSEQAILNWRGKKGLGPRCLNVYAASSFLQDSNPEAVWFADEWLTYGYLYSMSNEIAIPSCLNTSKADYLAYNTKMSLSDPGFKYIDGYYMDCCTLNLCPNRQHGCRVHDNFGRDVMRTNLLPLRDYFKRIVRLLHSQNRRLGAHGQFSFVPGIHGLCDYWITGEELRMGAIRDGVEIYCDRNRVADSHLRVNSNRNIFGGVEPCVLIYGKDNDYKRQLPAITRLLAEDIKVAGWFGEEGYNRMDKVWDAFKKYGADRAKCHRYFEQREVTSSNPDAMVTWYACPKGQTLLIAANLTDKSIETTLDLSALSSGNFTVADEISGAQLAVSEGKLGLVIPARDFRLVGFDAPHHAELQSKKDE